MALPFRWKFLTPCELFPLRKDLGERLREEEAGEGAPIIKVGHTPHHAMVAYSRPMPMSLGPPYERCGTLCLSNPCTGVTRVEGHTPPLGRSYTPTHGPTVGSYGGVCP